MKYEMTDIEKLILYPTNPKDHPESQIDQIAGSIKEFGFLVPIVVDSEMVIGAGHGRYLAARKLGLKEVPIVLADHLTKKQMKAFRLIDNQLTMNTGWNLPALELETEDIFEELKLDKFGFEKPEKLKEGLIEDDYVPEVDEKNTWVKTGDLFELGEHRLLCGDCTVKENVDRLMGGLKASLMNTDPPYGIDFVKLSNSKNQSIDYDEIENDNLSGNELKKFLEDAIRVAVPHLVINCPFYLWHPMLTQGTFFAAAAAADILIHRQIIWVKPSLVFGRGGLSLAARIMLLRLD